MRLQEGTQPAASPGTQSGSYPHWRSASPGLHASARRGSEHQAAQIEHEKKRGRISMPHKSGDAAGSGVLRENISMTDSTTILDMCCGSRMFWFNKQDTRAVFTDIRAEEHELCDGRRLVISPDLIADFRSLPFADSSFPVVVFDPPHLERVGQSAWMGKKYGRLNKKTWRSCKYPAYCGHTAFSYSNGTRRRSLLARFWHLQM